VLFNKLEEYNKAEGDDIMKLAVKFSKYLLLLLGAFIIFMAIDSFDGTDTFWGMLLEFLMNSIPGIVIFAMVFLLWKRELILGILMFALAIGLFFLFKFYRNGFENWLTMIIVETPLLTGGVLFTLNHFKVQKTQS